MNDRISAWFPLLLILLLAALTLWLDQTVQPNTPIKDGSKRHDPDYIVENFSAIRMNPNGTPSYKLSAKKMIHYPDDDSTTLDAPRFLYFHIRAPIDTTADRGMVSSNGENAYFEGNVKMVRAAFADQSELRLFTEYLHIIPDKSIAKTDKAVRIVNANTVINAIGLELNNETQILKLLSRVKINYQPRPSSAPTPTQ